MPPPLGGTLQETPKEEAVATSVEIEKLSPQVGAIAHGVDISQPLDAAAVRAIRAAVLESGVVFFRDRELTSEQMGDFMANFGVACNDPFTVAADAVKATRVIEMPTGRYARATAVWHYDSSLAAEPAALMGLRAVQLPSSGGDTCWSSGYAAYETLSKPIRDMVDHLNAEHSAFRVLDLMGIRAEDEHLVGDMRNIHPVVRVHPETGRRALFVDELWTESIVELEPHESDAILKLLFDHMKAIPHTLRWRWRVNDLALWDNRSFQHYAIRDYTETRVLQKALLKGDRPYGPN
jgi:taurine dioxygenase